MRAKVALQLVINCIVSLNHVENEDVLYDADEVAQREEGQRTDQEALLRLDVVLHLSIEKSLQFFHQNAVNDHQLDAKQAEQHNLIYDYRLVILHDQQDSVSDQCKDPKGQNQVENSFVFAHTFKRTK